MNLNEWRDEIHAVAIEHGWWTEERSFGDIIALCHSELSEALEEYRDGRPMVLNHCNLDDEINCEPGAYYHTVHCCSNCGHKDVKPEGIAIELADCIIRILDYCGHAGIDIEDAILMKHEFNKTRPWRHNGKVI